MAGSVGGMLAATAVGLTVHFTDSYMSVPIMAGGLYLVALVTFNLLVPKVVAIDMG